MTIEARMADGTVLRFPDGTPDDVIERAAREHAAGQGTPAPAAQPAEQPGIGDRIARQLGLFARGTMQGAAAIPGMVGDAASAAVNLPIRGVNAVVRALTPQGLTEQITGESSAPQIPLFGAPSQSIAAGIDAITPQPENATERVVNRIVREVAGLGPISAAASAGRGAGEIVRRVADAILTRPSLMVGGAVGAGTGAGVAAERFPDSPTAELIGGLAGGVAGTATPWAAQNGWRVVQALRRPLTERGRESIVGETVLRLSRDPIAARDALRSNPSEIVPGSLRTTAEVADDAGLYGGERAVRAMSPRAGGAFAARDAARNTARGTYLDETAPGGPLPMAEAGTQVRGRLVEALRGRNAETGAAYRAVPRTSGEIPGNVAYQNAARAVNELFADATAGTPAELLPILERLRNSNRLTVGAMRAMISEMGDLAGNSTGNLRLAATRVREALQNQLDDAAMTGNGLTAADASNLRVANALRSNQGAVYEEGAVGSVLDRNPYGRFIMAAEDVPRTLMGGPTAVRQLEAAIGADPAARTAMQGAFVQRARDAIATGTPDAAGNLIASPARFHGFLRQNRDTARILFGDDGLARLERIAADFASRQMADSVGRAIGSNTVQNLSTANVIAAATGGLINPTGLANSRLGAGLQFFYRGSEQALQELLTEAMLNPDVARRLVDRVSPANLSAIAQAMQQPAISRLGNAAVTGAIRQGAVTANTAVQQ